MLLVDFSLEVLELICGELDAYSAVACGRVCRVLHHIITTSQPIQYTITLAMRGMRAGRNESIDVGERLKMLERYETAWLECAWEESYRIAVTELTEGDDDPVDQFRVHSADGYLLTWSVVTGEVRAVRLPSPLRGISLEEHRWQFTPPPDSYRFETAMLLDAQNDVVMFVELASVGEHGALERKVTLHPFQLSSGNVPKCVPDAEIIILVEHNLSYNDFVLRNEFIIMRFHQGNSLDQGIMVYNWVTRRKLLHITTFDLLATFLDDKRIVVGFFSAEALEPGADPRLRVYDLSALNADGSAQATHDFPLPFRPNFFVKGRNCIGRECGHPLTYSGAYDRAQYFSEDDWSMIYICCDASEGGSFSAPGRSYRFKMHVCMKSLLRLVTECAASASLNTTIVPWSTWGHAAALSLDSNTFRSDLDMTIVTGSRMYGEMDRRHLLLQISDYHPARVRREAFDDRYLVMRDKVSDVAFLREGELQQPSSPDVPRAQERVSYMFAVPHVEPMDTEMEYALELSGDVILVTESEGEGPTAIVAYSLAWSDDY